MHCINFKSKTLITNMNEEGERKEFCYSGDGNCRECRYAEQCDWFLSINHIELID